MTDVDVAVAAAVIDPDDPNGARRWSRAPLLMAAAVVVAAALPYLGDRRFYLADDTTAAWLPVSRRIGDLLLDGRSHLMDPEMWRGGNFVASARYGVWNPVALAMDVSVLQLDDLALAMLIVTTVYLLVLAVGVYLLAREYGAAPAPSALAGLVAATGGWTLWLDATWWTPHLASLAWTPFVWIAARRVARRRASPIWFVAAAAMCVTVGNPYSAVVIGLIVVGVGLEAADRTDLRPLAWLAAGLFSVGLIACFVYLPFQQTAGVGFRESGIFNDERWAPDPGDLLVSSSPTATPFIRLFGQERLDFPAMYFAWFALPLAPWLQWRRLARRRFAALLVVAGAVAVIAAGPSNLWFFRWPLRLMPYVYLPLAVGFAVLLGAGFATDRRPSRSVLTAAAVVGAAYLSWADTPDDLTWHAAGAVLVGLSCAFSIRMGTRRDTRGLAAGLMIATLVVLAFQLQWRPFNPSVSAYRMSTSASEYVANFAGRYEGTVMQVASPGAIAAPDRDPGRAFRDITVGSTYAIADVEALTAYSALGFATHDRRLCIGFDGRTCADAFERLFAPSESGPLVDLLGIDTVVAQRALVETAERPPPAGWAIAEETEFVVVWKRTTTPVWPDSRLTSVAGPIDVGDATSPHAFRESVAVERTGTGAGRLTFARLLWPGYEASIDGRVLPVSGDDAGLVVVELPDDIDGGEVVLTWTPPYWRPSLAVLGLGLVLALGLHIDWRRRAIRAPTDAASMVVAAAGPQRIDDATR